MKKIKISDNGKAALIRWWLAGMCYYFIGFGTQLGSYDNPVDFIFFLALTLGFATVFLYNPVVYRTFDIKRRGKIVNQAYFKRTGPQNALLKLSEIFKNLFLVVLIFMTYQSVNLTIAQLRGLEEGTVTIPGEPFGFATLYVIFYYLLSGLTNTVYDSFLKEKQ